MKRNTQGLVMVDRINQILLNVAILDPEKLFLFKDYNTHLKEFG